MNKVIFILSLYALSLVSIIESAAQQGFLKAGDLAPELRVQEWIKGSPIASYEPGKFYLIELGAVGCAPCRLAIPHLSEIAKTYKNRLEVISVFTLESNLSDPKDLHYLQRIKKFISSVDSKIDYSVVADSPEQYMYERWGKAAGVTAIPSAFVVDGSTKQIVWIGYIEQIDEILAAVFSKKISIEDVERKNAHSIDVMERLITKIKNLNQADDMELALAKMDSLIAAHPKSKYFYWIKFDLLAGTDDDKAYECLQLILDKYGVQDYDWFHLIYDTYGYAKKPNYDLAHQVADRAIAQGTTNILVALALVEKSVIYYKQGYIQNAIDCCEKALELAKKDASSPKELKHFEENLKSFKKLQEEQQLKK
jgi:thiol-disulfide isomerase/thioredoxin